MKYCPRCLRTEADMPGCPDADFPGMSCPEPREEDPKKDVAVACAPCGFSRIIPVRMLIAGTAKSKLPTCKRDDCACVVVRPEGGPVPGTTAPAPIFDEGALDPTGVAGEPLEPAPAAPPKKPGKGKPAS